ncbi:VPS4-associated protein 1 [Halteromyces radiatus]|uniref:VPS4-associated protein 1 n=1 Tax=Halteromyces radiatus TaxID=101107 RepID=UPI0022200006|nr:VPS4-associated protein 1 [Halteromyces radiatus]KAI8082790.1 VPS4-associated protein 1 [Halteromyces radiatus]
MTSKIQNLYIARLTKQERPCFVCNKFTLVVLTSADNSNSDWFYTCRSHLGDFNFCSKVGGSPKPKATLPPQTSNSSLKDRPVESDSVVDLVSSIGSALTSWRKKPDDEKNKDKDKNKKDDKDDDNGNDNSNDNKEDVSSSASATPPPASTSPQPQAPPKFILQRDYFYLRQREHTKKQQKKEAEERLKTLQFPSVPKTIPSPKH